MLIVTGVLLVVAAGVWQGYSWLWARHVQQVGHQLVVAHQRRLATGRSDGSLPACGSAGTAGTSAGTGSDPVAGLLSIPSLDMLAPVEQGVADGTLAVAIGHIAASVWPGTTGTAILAAHDVSYFVDIDQLADGASIEYQTPCTTYHFSVSGHQVVQAGSPVYNSAGSTLVLETCWPTDALWYTPDRLLVTATEVGATPTTSGGDSAGSSADFEAYADAQPPTVDAPAALVAQGLTLDTNSIPMGALTESGNPQTSWVQSPAPLAVESSAIEAFIGGLKAAEQDNEGWWQAISGGATMPDVLQSASITDWHQGLDVTITTDGTTATGVTLSATVTVTGDQAGTYDMQVDEGITHGVLSLGSWQLTPYTG